MSHCFAISLLNKFNEASQACADSFVAIEIFFNYVKVRVDMQSKMSVLISEQKNFALPDPLFSLGHLTSQYHSELLSFAEQGRRFTDSVQSDVYEHGMRESKAIARRYISVFNEYSNLVQSLMLQQQGYEVCCKQRLFLFKTNCN